MPWLKKQDVPQWLFSTNTLSIGMESGEARYFVSDIQMERDVKNHRVSVDLLSNLQHSLTKGTKRND
jgi:hypothetical protein